MKIEVKLFAPLKAGRFEKAGVVLPEGSTVVDLLEKLDILPSDVGILAVNHREVAFHQKLKDGDSISILPFIGGG